jgi:hypothetical protein
MKQRSLRILLMIISFLVIKTGTAQDINEQVDTSGLVVVHKDPRLDLLVNKQIQINEETSRLARRTMKGYRLMVINTNKRDEAIAAKTQVYTYFPELKAYLQYQSPFFKLKAGNFKTRDEADEYRKRLNVYFPKGVFIMNDVIEVKPDDRELL